MEEQDVLDEVSGDYSASNQENIDDHLPAYLAYLALGFKVICTCRDYRGNGWLDYCHNQKYKKLIQ